VILYKHCF